MSKGGLIALVLLAPDKWLPEEKWKCRSEVYPLTVTRKGSIGFGFSRETNQLLSVQLYYAKYCLSNLFTEFSEYFRDGEDLKAGGFLRKGHQFIRFEEMEGQIVKSQIISMNEPNPGTAIIDSYNEETISSIELVGFS